MMYLEISPRQTGKTTRMLEAAADSIRAGYITFVVTMNYRLAREIERKIKNLFTPDPWGQLPSLKVWGAMGHVDKLNRLMLGNRALNENTVRLFYDEFEFMDDVLVVDTGYYVTSPKKTRTVVDIFNHKSGMVPDSMLELMDRNNGAYTSHSPVQPYMKMSLQQILDMRSFGDDIMQQRIFE